VPFRVAQAVRRDEDERRPCDRVAVVLGGLPKACRTQACRDVWVVNQFAMDRDLGRIGNRVVT
jgi:hypothetical protein